MKDTKDTSSCTSLMSPSLICGGVGSPILNSRHANYFQDAQRFRTSDDDDDCSEGEELYSTRRNPTRQMALNEPELFHRMPPRLQCCSSSDWNVTAAPAPAFPIDFGSNFSIKRPMACSCIPMREGGARCSGSEAGHGPTPISDTTNELHEAKRSI